MQRLLTLLATSSPAVGAWYVLSLQITLITRLLATSVLLLGGKTSCVSLRLKRQSCVFNILGSSCGLSASRRTFVLPTVNPVSKKKVDNYLENLFSWILSSQRAGSCLPSPVRCTWDCSERLVTWQSCPMPLRTAILPPLPPVDDHRAFLAGSTSVPSASTSDQLSVDF